MEERLWLWEGTAGPQVVNSPLPLADLLQVAFATFSLASGPLHPLTLWLRVGSAYFFQGLSEAMTGYKKPDEARARHKVTEISKTES